LEGLGADWAEVLVKRVPELGGAELNTNDLSVVHDSRRTAPEVRMTETQDREETKL